MNSKAFCSTEVVFSSHEKMKNIIISLDAANVVLVMSKSSADRQNLMPLVEVLEMQCKELEGKFFWIKDIKSNPTQGEVINSLKAIGNNKIDLIVAIGGGSSIDLAKAISAFHDPLRNDKYTIENITELIINKESSKNFIDIVAIPTTAGTGSEVTQWATIWDCNNKKKYSIDDESLKPKLAIIVPDFTLSMDKKMTISTGLDAICQAIEAYWSKHTTPIVQEIAYRAIEIILLNLRKVVDNPNDILLREKLCRASLMSGIAFSKTRTTACHSISYPLTMIYGIPHGFAVAMTLDSVSKINKGSFPNNDELYNLLDKHGGAKNWIDLVCNEIVDLRLSAFGITELDIPIIADNAFTNGRMDNNPVNLSKDDVIEILKMNL